MVETSSTWRQWVLRQMTRRGWHTQADVARHSTLTRSAISQWLDPGRDQTPSVDNCRRAAEAFGSPILEALVAAGHITAAEAGVQIDTIASIVDFSALELVADLRRRIEEYELELNSITKGQQKRKTATKRESFSVPPILDTTAEGNGSSAVR